MEIQLTERAAAEYDILRSCSMTPEMASRYLQEGNIVLRTFADTLREQYVYPNLQSRLVSSFCAYEPEASTASITKKIKNWLSGKNAPTNREDIFRIGFALDFTEKQTSFLLGQCTEYGIHYRDSRDVIYAWFLRNDYGYADARDFYESLPPVPTYNNFPEPEIAGKDITHITRNMQSEFYSVHTIDGLESTYEKNLPRFGYLHVRAYKYFEKYLRQLTHPGNSYNGTDEANYSIETVMDYYLSLHMPSDKNRSRYTLVQKLLKKNWPNATTLKNICAHKADVPRKLLLIMYVVTENIFDDDEEIYEDLSIQERLEKHWWMIDAMLSDCGMPTLDPRNVMDWLILYALTADDDESASERMESVIDDMFSE